MLHLQILKWLTETISRDFLTPTNKASILSPTFYHKSNMTPRKTVTKTRRHFYAFRCIHAEKLFVVWNGRICLCVCLHYVCYTSKLRFHHCPKTLQNILLNFQSILPVNHYILEILVPERTRKFQEITDFRKLPNYNKNSFVYILLHAYAFIFKWNVCISRYVAVEIDR